MMQSPTNDEYTVDDPDVLARLEEYADWKSLPRRHFIHHVERGRLGLNMGIPSGLVKVDQYTYGTRPGIYYLTGGDSGTGKTTLVDFMRVLNAYEHCRKTGKKLHLIYFSFEISKHMKQLKWVAFYVWITFGVRLPTGYIDGNIKGKVLTDEHMRLVSIGYAYVERLMNSITFIEDVMHPTAIWVHMLNHFSHLGTINRHKPDAHSKLGRIIDYTPNEGEEDSTTIMVLDHIALVGVEQGYNTKQLMDLMSKYIVALRNLFEMTAVVVQQFNTELTTMNRDSYKKVSEASIAPQRVDFGDSTYTFRDADVVLGLIAPARFDMKSFMEYNVTMYGSKLVIMYLVKNRYGDSDKKMPLFLDPIAGTFQDITPPEESEISNKLKAIAQCQLNYRNNP